MCSSCLVEDEPADQKFRERVMPDLQNAGRAGGNPAFCNECAGKNGHQFPGKIVWDVVAGFFPATAWNLLPLVKTTFGGVP